MIDTCYMVTHRAHDVLTIVTSSCVFSHTLVMFGDSLFLATHTDVLVACCGCHTQARDDGGL